MTNPMQLFPARAAIATLQPNGQITATPEFLRALQQLVGIVNNNTNQLYYGTGFPADVTGPALLIKFTGDGQFSDFVVREP